MKLIGIFQGKQATHNVQILNLLYDNGPLTAWEIAGKISPRSRISLHATLNKRLRSLENKGYLKRADTKWCLQFKGIIAALLIQKTPRPLSSKWTELIENYAKYVDDHYQALSDITIQGNGIIIHPLETIKKTGQTLRTFDDWVALSAYVKELIQTGVVNFDVISNETLFVVILTEFSSEQREDLMKDWNLKMPT
jgi:DNA-binding Lrp family transcriptional regulator